jgi:hypothetical protein
MENPVRALGLSTKRPLSGTNVENPPAGVGFSTQWAAAGGATSAPLARAMILPTDA